MKEETGNIGDLVKSTDGLKAYVRDSTHDAGAKYLDGTKAYAVGGHNALGGMQGYAAIAAMIGMLVGYMLGMSGYQLQNNQSYQQKPYFEQPGKQEKKYN